MRQPFCDDNMNEEVVAEKKRNSPCAREKPRPDWKKDLQPVAREENHEKGLRWSWARNQMGNPD
jgi:hypothetical protein